MAGSCGCKKSPLKMCGCEKKSPAKKTLAKTKSKTSVRSTMKKLCIVMLLSLPFIGSAQDTIQSSLICSNEYRSRWFIITPHFKEYDGTSKKDYLITIKANIGQFSNKDVLKFTFKDGKYMKVKSSEGLTFINEELTFPLNPIQTGVLQMKPVKSIEYINGNDKSNFLYILTKEDEKYFINILAK